jgi:hypothetical protein
MICQESAENQLVNEFHHAPSSHTLKGETRNLNFGTFKSGVQFDLIDGGMRNMHAHKGQ